MLRWGFGLEQDDKGRMWCELRQLGVRVPCYEKNPERGEVRPEQMLHAEGPGLVQVPVVARASSVQPAIQ